MPIASDALRGYTEAIILRRLMDKDSYGYEINKTIQEKTKGQYELKEATLYTAFRRLEQAGYILSYWGDEKTGARRRYYAITKERYQSANRTADLLRRKRNHGKQDPRLYRS